MLTGGRRRRMALSLIFRRPGGRKTMSTQLIYQAVARALERATAGRSAESQLLDIGAGRGELITLLGEWMRIKARACDFHAERFALKDVEIQQINLNLERLPYAEQSFDIVTCSEVIEHLENYRDLLRQVHRILKPGGLFVITTPNVLNLKSRIRYFFTGFASLFGPLPVKNLNLASTGGHITPIPYFYLAHALLDADFAAIELSSDKAQKTSRAALILFAPLLWLGWKRFKSREAHAFKTLDVINSPYVEKHNSTLLLLGRTVICLAKKAT
jgi:SAM-dependent methyltransferase